MTLITEIVFTIPLYPDFFKGIQENGPKKDDVPKQQQQHDVQPIRLPEPPPVKRYYGRKRGNESDSELSMESEDSEDEKEREVKPKNGNNARKGTSSTKVSKILLLLLSLCEYA